MSGRGRDGQDATGQRELLRGADAFAVERGQRRGAARIDRGRLFPDGSLADFNGFLTVAGSVTRMFPHLASLLGFGDFSCGSADEICPLGWCAAGYLLGGGCRGSGARDGG
jgi:hypothetical protein